LDNVCFSSKTPALIDFAECGCGPSALELACYWRKRVLAGAQGLAWRDEWRALLEGYGSVRPLDQHELRATPALAVLRAIRTMAMPALPGCEPWGRTWLQDRKYFQAHLEMIDRPVVPAPLWK
jgi:Ser/Thr protein kinase RdoA (MazF antagonist)